MNIFSYIKRILKKCFYYVFGDRIKVVYRSENFILINKDYDVKINSNNKNEKTVQTMLRKAYPHLANRKLFHEYYFPHRLDFATSGVMCIPTHKEACRIVSASFFKRTSKKYYIAIVRGIFSKQTLVLNMPIGEDITGKDIQKMCVGSSPHCEKARDAKTLFLVLEEGLYDKYPSTKILIRPISGRRHQIRVHCAYLGHTIVGDYTYSNRRDTKPNRMYLHCIRLTLPNPLEDLDITTCDPFSNVSEWQTIKTINIIDDSTYSKFESLL